MEPKPVDFVVYLVSLTLLVSWVLVFLNYPRIHLRQPEVLSLLDRVLDKLFPMLTVVELVLMHPTKYDLICQKLII